MSRIKVYFPSNAQPDARAWPRQSGVPVGVSGSTKTRYLFQAVGFDREEIDITGWTVAGTIKRRKNNVVTACGGTLIIDTDPDNSALGYFEWTPSSANLATADMEPGYEVQFVLTSTTDLVSLPMQWRIFQKNTV